MKQILIYGLLVTIVLVSCVKKNTPLVAPPITNPVDTSMVNSLYFGRFENGPYGNVRGLAKIYLQNNQYYLILDSFLSSNGPDLYVYLSKEPQPINFISLGRLQAVTGRQQYQIGGSPDFSLYKYALIHCQRFNHLFGKAELE